MILPSTYLVALLLTLFTMLCWGSWANTLKIAGKWRFELFYFDYSLGVLLLAIVAGFTFGSLGEDLSFLDNLAVARARYIVYGIAAGVIFNLANMLLVAAISIAGMSVAFPVSIGLALVIGVIWNYILSAQGHPALLFGGVALVLVAIVVDARAYRAYARAQRRSNADPNRSGAPAGAAPAVPPRATQARRPAKAAPAGSSTLKGIVISLISGVLMGSFYPLVELSKQGELGLGPYAVGFIFACGVFASTFVYNLIFMNLPLQGEPIEVSEYFQGTWKQHLLGIAGGIIWCAGTIANFAAASAPPEVNVGPAVSYAMGQGATLISALWGLLVWKEFAGADEQVRRLLALMLALFVIGLTLVSIAPLFPKSS
jgi:glucose uptake protein